MATSATLIGGAARSVAGGRTVVAQVLGGDDADIADEAVIGTWDNVATVTEDDTLVWSWQAVVETDESLSGVTFRVRPGTALDTAGDPIIEVDLPQTAPGSAFTFAPAVRISTTAFGADTAGPYVLTAQLLS